MYKKGTSWAGTRHSVEYDWLGPYLTQNTQGQYILILPAVLITLATLRHST